MWVLIACLVLLNVAVLSTWLRERRRHRQSREALRWWRRRSVYSDLPLGAGDEVIERDMASTRAALRRLQRDADPLRGRWANGGAA